MARSRHLESLCGSLCIILLGASPSIAEKGPSARGTLTTIKGEIMPVSCDIALDNGQTKYSDCDVNCKARENAVGLADDRGKIYVLLDPKSKGVWKAGEKRFNQELSISGKLIEEDGMSPVLYVYSVK